MKITRRDLSVAVGVVGHVVGKSRVLPVLGNFLLSPDNGVLRVSGSDSEIFVTCSVKSTGDGLRVVAVPKLFEDVVKSIDTEEIQLQMEGNVISLVADRQSARFNVMPMEEFPPVPKVSNVQFTVDAEKLETALQKVLVAVSSENNRPVLSGVLFELGAGSVTMTAADGFRLASIVVPIDGGTGDPFIVPGKALNVLLRLVKAFDDKHVKVGVENGHVGFWAESYEEVSEVIAGTYPDWRNLVPKEFKTMVTMNKKELLVAVKSVTAVAKGNEPVRLEFKGNEATVWLNTDHIDGAKVTLDVKIEGEPNKVALEAKYLTQAVAPFDGAEVKLKLTSGTAPVLFQSDESYLQVVMPKFVQWPDEV